MDKKTMITSIMIPIFSIIASIGVVFLTRYFEQKGEKAKLEKAKINNINIKIDNIEKIHAYDTQTIKDRLFKDEIEHEKLLNAYKMQEQKKYNDLKGDVQRLHLQFEYVDSRYRKADAEIKKQIEENEGF